MYRPRSPHFVTAILACLAALSYDAHAQTTDSLSSYASIKNRFEWGEYDSLIAEGERFLAAPQSGVGAADTCRIRLYLGVAYYAGGRIGEAREEFERGLACDSSLDLDSRYVSTEIYDFFSLTLQDHRRKRAERDSLERAEARQTAAARESIEQERLLRLHRRIATSAVLSYSAAVVLAGAGAAIAVSAHGAYDEYLVAAREGDKRTYDQRARDLQYVNVAFVACAAGALVTGVTGGIFTHRVRRGTSVGAWVVREQSGVAIGMEF